MLERRRGRRPQLPETLQGIVAARIEGSRPGEGAAPGRIGARQGVLDRRACDALRARRRRARRAAARARAAGVRPTGAALGRRGRAPVRRSSTRSSATQPTVRSRALPAPRSTGRPPTGSSGCPPTARRTGPRRLPTTSRRRSPTEQAAGSTSPIYGRRGRGAARGGRPGLGAQRPWTCRALLPPRTRARRRQQSRPRAALPRRSSAVLVCRKRCRRRRRIRASDRRARRGGKDRACRRRLRLLARARWEQQILPTELFARWRGAGRTCRRRPPAPKFSEPSAHMPRSTAIANVVSLSRSRPSPMRAPRGRRDRGARAQLAGRGAGRGVPLRGRDRVYQQRSRARARGRGSNDASRCLINLASFEFGLGLLEDSNARFRDVLVLARRSEANRSRIGLPGKTRSRPTTWGAGRKRLKESTRPERCSPTTRTSWTFHSRSPTPRSSTNATA